MNSHALHLFMAFNCVFYKINTKLFWRIFLGAYFVFFVVGSTFCTRNRSIIESQIGLSVFPCYIFTISFFSVPSEEAMTSFSLYEVFSMSKSIYYEEAGIFGLSGRVGLFNVINSTLSLIT